MIEVSALPRLQRFAVCTDNVQSPIADNLVLDFSTLPQFASNARWGLASLCGFYSIVDPITDPDNAQPRVQLWTVRAGSWTSESVLLGWHFPLPRADRLPELWDGRLNLDNAGPWGYANGMGDVIMYVAAEIVRLSHPGESAAIC